MTRCRIYLINIRVDLVRSVLLGSTTSKIDPQSPEWCTDETRDLNYERVRHLGSFVTKNCGLKLKRSEEVGSTQTEGTRINVVVCGAILVEEEERKTTKTRPPPERIQTSSFSVHTLRLQLHLRSHTKDSGSSERTSHDRDPLSPRLLRRGKNPSRRKSFRKIDNLPTYIIFHSLNGTRHLPL